MASKKQNKLLRSKQVPFYSRLITFHNELNQAEDSDTNSIGAKDSIVFKDDFFLAKGTSANVYKVRLLQGQTAVQGGSKTPKGRAFALKECVFTVVEGWHPANADKLLAEFPGLKEKIIQSLSRRLGKKGQSFDDLMKKWLDPQNAQSESLDQFIQKQSQQQQFKLPSKWGQHKESVKRLGQQVIEQLMRTYDARVREADVLKRQHETIFKLKLNKDSYENSLFVRALYISYDFEDQQEALFREQAKRQKTLLSNSQEKAKQKSKEEHKQQDKVDNEEHKQQDKVDNGEHKQQDKDDGQGMSLGNDSDNVQQNVSQEKQKSQKPEQKKPQTRIKGWMVMDYCPNGNIKQFLDRLRRADNQISHREMLYIIKKVVQGLAELQKLNYIHRDIKLENIMLDANCNIKIIDFGLSYELKGSNQKHNCGDPAGTPLYMAPEVLTQRQMKKTAADKKDLPKDLPKYDGRADVYSAGVLLFFLYFGKFGRLKELKLIQSGRTTQQTKQLSPDAQRIEKLLEVMLEEDQTDKMRPYKNRPFASQLAVLNNKGGQFQFDLKSIQYAQKGQKNLKSAQWRWFTAEGSKQQEELQIEKQVRKSLMQKKSAYKCQVKRVIGTPKGFIIVLQNGRVSVVQYIKNSNKHELYKISQQLVWAILHNATLPADKRDKAIQQGYPAQPIKNILRTPTCINFFQEWWECEDIDDFAGDNTVVTKITTTKEGIIFVTLNNDVFQCFFPEQQRSQPDKCTLYSKSVSVNYHKKQPKRIRVQKNFDYDFDEFQSHFTARENPESQKFVEFVQKASVILFKDTFEKCYELGYKPNLKP